jgi:hypothetical protein
LGFLFSKYGGVRKLVLFVLFVFYVFGIVGENCRICYFYVVHAEHREGNNKMYYCGGGDGMYVKRKKAVLLLNFLRW